MVPGLTAGDGRGDGQPPAFEDPFDAPQVLRRRFDLSPTAHQDDHLGARVAPEVDVGGRPNMVPPPVLSSGKALEDVSCRRAVQEGDDAQGIRVRVGQGSVRKLLANEGPDRVGAAGAVSFANPSVE